MAIIIALMFTLAVLLTLQGLFQTKTRTKQKALWRSWSLNSKVSISADVWPDVVDDLASAIRAGMSLPQALTELSKSGPLVLRPIICACLVSYHATGDFTGALMDLKNAVDDPTADKFVAALVLAHEVGGADLGQVLKTLSEVLRADAKIRGEIVARQSWTINGAKLAVAAPWLTALVLCTHSEASKAYLSPGGIRILLFCLLTSVIAYATMMRISQLPKEIRVLS